MTADNDAPPPLTAVDCDLRDFPRMQLDIPRLRRSKSWLVAKRQPELGFYMVNLWTAAWHELPAASLEDDDDVLADLAMCDPHHWPTVRALVLRRWVKCNDGRLYHPVVAQIAIEARDRKNTYRERTSAARLARNLRLKGESDRAKASVNDANVGATVSVTEGVRAATASVTETVDQDTNAATDTVEHGPQSLLDGLDEGPQSLSTHEKHAPQFLKGEGEGEGDKKERSAPHFQRKLLDDMVAVWNATCGDVLPQAKADIPAVR